MNELIDRAVSGDSDALAALLFEQHDRFPFSTFVVLNAR
jgi:hypothetical protein